jgi:hypothetical protein
MGNYERFQIRTGLASGLEEDWMQDLYESGYSDLHKFAAGKEATRLIRWLASQVAAKLMRFWEHKESQQGEMVAWVMDGHAAAAHR